MSIPYIPGWIPDPAEVDRIAGMQPYPTFSDTPASRVARIPNEVFLWKFYEANAAKPWPSRNQGGVGSCVSFGTAAAIEATMSAEIFNGDIEEQRDLCQEVIYGGSRVEIGGGRVGGDGSIGAWAAEFVRIYGVIDRGIYGKYDLTKYDERRCREWGNRGVPDDLEPEVKKHPIQTVTMVRTWEDAKAALAQGYGIAICSGQGFTMQRDADGFARASGSWAHCMALLGYQQGKREGGWICNSWGPSAHTGPGGAGDPPPCGFWADAATINRMLGEKDSWAFSAVQGFPLRKIRWYI